jgi:hypothetical protein
MATKTKLAVAAIAVFALGVASTLALVRVALHPYALGAAACQVNDITGTTDSRDKAIISIGGLDWLSHARVCEIGGFTIVVPAAQTEGHIIDVYKGLKPVFQRTRDGTLVFSPTVPDRRFDEDIVNIWHPCEGDVSRLFYTTRGKEPHITVEDQTFVGLPNKRIVWNGHDIQETFVMYQDAWHQLDKGKMLIGDQWKPMRYTAGEWRIKDPNDTEPATKSSDAFTCPDTK